jgi:hypothetical protein
VVICFAGLLWIIHLLSQCPSDEFDTRMLMNRCLLISECVVVLVSASMTTQVTLRFSGHHGLDTVLISPGVKVTIDKNHPVLHH